MRPGSLRSVPVAAPSVQGKPCKARNGRWTGRPHRESPRASVSASPVTIYHNACLKTQSDRLLGGHHIGRIGRVPAAENTFCVTCQFGEDLEDIDRHREADAGRSCPKRTHHCGAQKIGFWTERECLRLPRFMVKRDLHPRLCAPCRAVEDRIYFRAI